MPVMVMEMGAHSDNGRCSCQRGGTLAWHPVPPPPAGPSPPGWPGCGKAQGAARDSPEGCKQSATLGSAMKSTHMLGAGFPEVRDRPGRLGASGAAHMEGRALSGDSADRNRPSALFAGVLNDYIISSVCSTLLFLWWL